MLKRESHNAAGNGLTILKHRIVEKKSVVLYKGTEREKTEDVEILSVRIRQNNLFPNTAKRFVAYTIRGHTDNKSFIKRAKWERKTPPPEDFVALGRQLGLLG